MILVFRGGPKLVSQIGSKADFEQHFDGMVRLPGASYMVSWRLLEPPSGRRELVILVFGGGPKLVSQIGSKADFKQHPHGMARFPGASNMVSWRLLGPFLPA